MLWALSWGTELVKLLYITSLLCTKRGFSDGRDVKTPVEVYLLKYTLYHDVLCKFMITFWILLHFQTTIPCFKAGQTSYGPRCIHNEIPTQNWCASWKDSKLHRYYYILSFLRLIVFCGIWPTYLQYFLSLRGANTGCLPPQC